jgi:2-keto-4-pentenoate hydratase
MNMTEIEQVGRALLAARRDRRPSDAAGFGDALRGVADAYAVQEIVARGMGAQQQVFPRYWKSGGSGLGPDVPHAALPPEGVWTSPADARSWPFNLYLVEAEIALRLACDVTAAQAAGMAVGEARELVDAMTVAIELVDSRWQQGPSAPALLKLADLQSHGALVLGDWVAFAPRDWAAQTFTVQIGSQPGVMRCGTHPQNDPAALLPGWLRHATRVGDAVPAGTVVTTGSWCGMLPAAAGNLVVVRFEGVGEASVQL